MRSLTLKTVFHVAFFLVLFASDTTSDAQTTPEIRAWDVESRDLVSELSPRQWNLVMVWSVTCGICAVETPALSDFHEDPGTPPVRLLGLSIDGPAARADVAQWMREHRMRFPTLLARVTDVAAYLVGIAGEPLLGTPTFLLFDPAGELVGINQGPLRIEALRAFVERKSG